MHLRLLHISGFLIGAGCAFALAALIAVGLDSLAACIAYGLGGLIMILAAIGIEAAIAPVIPGPDEPPIAVQHYHPPARAFRTRSPRIRRQS